MASTPKRPADLNRRAFSIVQIATGETQDKPKKASAAKAGKAGGKARAAKIGADERKAIAAKGAKARWGKHD